MILLGIDTCGSNGTLALGRVLSRDRRDAAAGLVAATGVELLATAELPGRSAAATLVPQLGQIFADAGLALAEVSALVVVDGPGSFTGIRIGISTAKALADAWTVPLFAISRLRVLAQANGSVSAVLDAGRGEFYYGRYASPALPGLVIGESHSPDASAGEWLLSADELRERLAPGDAPHVACEQKVVALFPQVTLVNEPTAANALRAALPHVLLGQQADVATLDGRYLRRSDLYRTASST